jgi:excisionase family DNA binding protein
MPDQKPAPLSYRYKAASVATGISERKLSDLVRDHKIPFLRIGSAVLFPVAELERWLSDQTQGPAK